MLQAVLNKRPRHPWLLPEHVKVEAEREAPRALEKLNTNSQVLDVALMHLELALLSEQ